MINIGNRREVFFDNFLIDEEKTTAQIRLHHPVRREAAIVHNEVWEGNACIFSSAFFAEGKWRLYYRSGSDVGGSLTYFAYAESEDGVSWRKPALDIIEIGGTKRNNAILDADMARGWGCKTLNDFYVFYDNNPACPPDEKYKAVMSTDCDDKLISLVSSDGLHFEFFGVITDDGTFDSQNLAFWSEEHGKYFCYFRGEHITREASMDEYSFLKFSIDRLWDEDSLSHRQPTDEDDPYKMMRDVRVMTSVDFVNWTESSRIEMKDDRIQLYTNVISPYPRAPHVLVGFPTRYHERKAWTPNYDELVGREDRLRRMEGKYHAREGLAITDGLFMCSRDGYSFKRYDEAFMPPPVEHPYSWVYGDCYLTAGLVETPSDIPFADNEYSLFVVENYRSKKGYDVLMRYTIRLDGFVSRHSGDAEELLVTKEFVYDGEEMYVNLATSAKGHAYFTLKCGDEAYRSYEIFGNSTDKKVSFIDPTAVAKLCGKPVTLEIKLLDADIYALRFGE